MNKNFRVLPLLLTTAFISTPAFSIERYSYDFDTYTPTLDRRYSAEQATINSGYSVSFDATASQDDNDFVYYKINDDMTTTPVYYKANQQFIGNQPDRVGETYTSMQSNNTDTEVFAGYFNGINGTSSSIPSAFYNTGSAYTLQNLYADFVGNHRAANTNSIYGGAMQNGSIFGSKGNVLLVSGDFIKNTLDNTKDTVVSASNPQAGGAAIVNVLGYFGKIEGNFIGNSVTALTTAAGGAILNISGEIREIEGMFIGNHAVAEGANARGGAIFNSSAIWHDEDHQRRDMPYIKADFIGNYAIAADHAYGGAICDTPNQVSTDIWGMFIGNYVKASSAYGGALFENGNVNGITGSFVNNYAISETANGMAYGGAIYAGGNMRYIADGLNNYFTGNYTIDHRGKMYNAIFMANTHNDDTLLELTFDITEGGNLYVNDNIYGRSAVNNPTIYNVTINGYNSGKFFLNNYIAKAEQITVNDSMFIFNKAPYDDDTGCGADCRGQIVSAFEADAITPKYTGAPVTSLTLNNSQLYLYNGYVDNVRVKNYTTSGNTLLHVDIIKQNGQWLADKIYVDGQIRGNTNVVVYDKTNENNSGVSVLFIEAPNDDGVEFTNSVFRTYGSPYKWDIAYNYNNETTGSYWYLVGTDDENEVKFRGFVPGIIQIDDDFNLPDGQEPDPDSDPDPDPDPDPQPDPQPQPAPEPDPEVLPEVVVGIGLHESAIEQTRSVARNVRNEVATNRENCPDCDAYSYDEEGKQLNQGWVLAQGETANLRKPVDIDANIWGVEAGFDMQKDINNVFGIFGSYRKGDYDLNGKAHRRYSTIGSEIDIDSWLGGLYYRYDKNAYWLFATVYGGAQKAEIQTNDGVAKFHTTGIELGASAEAGYAYALSEDITLNPSIGLSYTQIDFENAKDNVGKRYKWDCIKHFEIEAGVKAVKQFDTANIYIKPSIIHTLTGDDRIAVTGLGRAETFHDSTLGRVEIGGQYGINDALSAYTWGNYTFASKYEAVAGGLGISYAW